MRIKHLLLTALLLPLSALAQETTLVVELNDGKTANFLLEEQPVLTMNGTKLFIATDRVQTSYERADIKHFFFTGKGSDIKLLPGKTVVFKQISSDQLEITGLSEKDAIVVFDIAGKQQGSVSRTDNSAVVSLSGQQKGIYLIKVGKSQTIKFIKK